MARRAADDGVHIHECHRETRRRWISNRQQAAISALDLGCKLRLAWIPSQWVLVGQALAVAVFRGNSGSSAEVDSHDKDLTVVIIGFCMVDNRLQVQAPEMCLIGLINRYWQG